MNNVGGSSSTQEQLSEAVRKGTRVAAIGVVASAFLATTKIAAGVIGNSFALVADGVESVLDIFSGLLVWGGLRVSAVPQSERFPYGLGKAEPLASLVVSTVLLLAAAGIALGAAQEIRSPQEVPQSFTLIVLVGVLIAKELMFRLLSARARDIGSQSLNSDAWHHRSDALTSLAAFVGITVALTAGEGFESADDWAALVACIVITFNGVRLFRASLREVLDVTAPKEVRDRIREITESVPGVDGVDLLRVRQSGLALWVDIHVEVEGEMPVRAGHHIAHLVKDALLHSDLRILDALVHVEPHSLEPQPGPGPDSEPDPERRPGQEEYSGGR
jgi:cation diffusion facilitator family transporter